MATEIKVTKQVKLRARALLKAFTEEGYESEALSGVGETTIARLKPKNIGDVVIVRRNDGFWVANVLLKKMPAGAPNSFGTPEAYPKATKEEALEDAAQNLAYAYWLAERNTRRSRRGEPEPADVRVFDLDGMEFHFPGDLVDTAVSRLSDMDVPVSPADLRYRLEQRLNADFPNGVDEATWNTLASEKQEIYSVLCCALLSMGEFRVSRNDAGRKAAGYEETPSNRTH